MQSLPEIKKVTLSYWQEQFKQKSFDRQIAERYVKEYVIKIPMYQVISFERFFEIFDGGKESAPGPDLLRRGFNKAVPEPIAIGTFTMNSLALHGVKPLMSTSWHRPRHSFLSQWKTKRQQAR